MNEDDAIEEYKDLTRGLPASVPGYGQDGPAWPTRDNGDNERNRPKEKPCQE